MKLCLPRWLREERKPTDAELESSDRRLFLRGAMVTSAGLVVARRIISVPKAMPRVLMAMDWAASPMAGTITYFVVDNLGRTFKTDCPTTVVATWEELHELLPKHGGGRNVQIFVRPA